MITVASNCYEDCQHCLDFLYHQHCQDCQNCLYKNRFANSLTSLVGVLIIRRLLSCLSFHLLVLAPTPFLLPHLLLAEKKEKMSKNANLSHDTSSAPLFKSAKNLSETVIQNPSLQTGTKTAFMPHWAVFVRHARSFGETTLAAAPAFPP